MNYRHIYHAGNFADIVKHCILIVLMDYLSQKPKPFCVLDTHAGIGLYALNSIESQKTMEYENGVLQLLKDQNSPMPDVIKDYQQMIQSYQTANDANLTIYPGSPSIILNKLREHDQLVASELHPDDYETLKKNIKATRQGLANVHHMNGYHTMKAFLPPKQARGLVLIDPPFEKASEFDDIIAALTLALKNWRGGMFMIWYPVKDDKVVKRFETQLKRLGFPLMLVTAALAVAEISTGMQCCAVAIINPPWLLKDILNDKIVPYLSKALKLKMHVSLS